jgi:thiamine kinase-like enzyme
MKIKYNSIEKLVICHTDVHGWNMLLKDDIIYLLEILYRIENKIINVYTATKLELNIELRG